MKKTISIIALLAIGITLFPSCNKCTTCTKSGGNLTKLCRNSYNSNGDYNTAVAIYSNTGWDCN